MEVTTYKLNEFSIDDFRKYISPKTLDFRKRRLSAKGKEIKIAKIVDFDFNTNTLTIETDPTYDFSVWTFPDGATGKVGEEPSAYARRDSKYTIKIELVDLNQWKDSSWEKMTLKEFKEILKLVDIKLNCTCPAYYWQGHRYELTTLDSAIYPYSGKDKGIWRKQRHENKAGLCKHLAAVMPFLNFHAPALLKVIRESAQSKKITEEAITPTKAAQEKIAFVQISDGNYIRGYLYKPLKEPKLIGFAEMSYETSNPYDSYILERTAAERGYGPLLYDIMMSIADKKGKPVSPDRYSVSKYAKNVWDFYFDKRKDVSHLPIDDKKHPLTKDKIDDGEVHYPLRGDDISKRKHVDYVYWIDKPINFSQLVFNHKEWLNNSDYSISDFKNLMHKKGEQFFHQMYGKNY